MYIELFLLDNLLMDALLVRLAGALCAVRIPWRRLFAACAFGAAYAWAALFLPVLMSFPCKVASGLLMALSIPFGGLRGYVRAASSLFLSAFLTGGLALCASLCLGGRLEDGVILGPMPLRAALIVISAASYLPAAARRMLSLRILGEQHVQLLMRFCGRDYELDAIVDTGNCLIEPLSALPVAIAHIPELVEKAYIPIPAQTITGEALLMAFKPDLITIKGAKVPLNALVAPVARPIASADAILPPVLIHGRQ